MGPSSMTGTAGFFEDDTVSFPENQRPIFAGSPARPLHPISRRAAYAAVGVLLGLTSGFGNALVLTNVTYLLGPLGADTTEAAWVPVAYVMTFITMNLLLVKFRQQFGLRPFVMIGVIGFCAVTAVHLFAGGLVGAIYVHALAGVATAPLLTLTIYYFIAAVPNAKALQGAVFGLAFSQVSTPLSRLFPGNDFIHDQWITFYAFELGMGLLSLVAVGLVRLPPSEREGGFEKLDVISYPLIASGLALLTAVVGLGRYEWWIDRAWLGWCLAAAIPLILAAIWFESCRSRPLLDVRWLGREGLFRFAIVVIVLRIVLAQQQSTAFGLLSNAGVLTTEVRFFSLMLTAAALLGCFAAALLVQPQRILSIGAAGLGIIAVAAYVESFSTNLTRAHELLPTEMMIAFASTFAVGPTIGHGLGKVLKAGGPPLGSFLVVLAITQNLGGLGGSALLGTYQIIQAKSNSVALVETAPAFDAVIQARLARGGGGATGTMSLQKAMTREANVLAYNNTSFLVALLAALAAAYLAGRAMYERHIESRASSK
jgi:hypothetical protein